MSFIMLSFLLISAASLLSIAAAQNSSSDNIVDLGYARYRGVQNDSYPKYTDCSSPPPFVELKLTMSKHHQLLWHPLCGASPRRAPLACSHGYREPWRLRPEHRDRCQGTRANVRARRAVLAPDDRAKWRGRLPAPRCAGPEDAGKWSVARDAADTRRRFERLLQSVLHCRARSADAKHQATSKATPSPPPATLSLTPPAPISSTLASNTASAPSASSRAPQSTKTAAPTLASSTNAQPLTGSNATPGTSAAIRQK